MKAIDSTDNTYFAQMNRQISKYGPLRDFADKIGDLVAECFVKKFENKYEEIIASENSTSAEDQQEIINEMYEDLKEKDRTLNRCLLSIRRKI